MNDFRIILFIYLFFFKQYESQSTNAATPAAPAAAQPEAEKGGDTATAMAAAGSNSGAVVTIDDSALSAMVEKQKDLVKRSREAIAATKRLTLKKEFSQNILKR